MSEFPTLHIKPTKAILERFPGHVLDIIDQRCAFFADEASGAAPTAMNNDLDQMEVWDGWVRFLDRWKNPPELPLGLRDIALQTAYELGVHVEVKDWRRPPDPDPGIWGRYPEPISLWPHQEACAQAMLSSLDGVAEMPPRAGKTRTLFEVVRRLGLPTFWVAPTNSIVDQTVQAAREFFMAHDAVRVNSQNQGDVTDALLTVATAGTIASLKDPFWKSRQVLVADEIHHYLGQKGWGQKLVQKAPHIVHRKGMTGTFFRSNGDDLAMHAFLSRSLFRITSHELEQKGYLVPCYSVFVPITGPKVRRPKGHPKTFNGPGGHGTLGIAKHVYRNDVVASVAKHLSDLGRTVLVLVSTKHQGYEVQKRLEPMFPPKKPNQTVSPVEFVSTDRHKHRVTEVLDSFRSHGNCRVLIGTSMVGEGTDLPPADALVYAAGGKAAVTLTQAWYRVITKTEEKRYAVIVDFYDQHHKRLWEHSYQRWNTMAQDPIFKMSFAPDLHHFEQWCRHLASSAQPGSL